MKRALSLVLLCLASSLVLAQAPSLQDIEARLKKAKAAQSHQQQLQREAQQREAARQAQIEAENRERARQQEAARQQQIYQQQQAYAAQQAAEERRRQVQQCKQQCEREADRCLNYINPMDCQRTNYSSPQAAQAQLLANLACVVNQNGQRKNCNNSKTQCQSYCN
jgi:hypothetical protein